MELARFWLYGPRMPPFAVWRRLVAALSALVALLAGPGPLAAADKPLFRPDRLLIRLKPAAAARAAAHPRHVLRRLGEDGATQLVALAPGEDPIRVAEAYIASGAVEFAEPDYWVHAAALPNDTAYLDGFLWHLHNTGANDGKLRADINALTAWDTIREAPNVVVAFVDSGILTTHEDLKPNLWVNPGEIPGNGLDDDNNGYVDDLHGIDSIANTGALWDQAGHGSHVAGVAGAAGNNGLGATGVAWKVQLMGLRFLDGFGDGSISDALECIDYARRMGAHIINASWGGPENSAALLQAFRAARDAGIIVVAAAGNNARNNDATPFYPASFDLDNIVSVCATTRADEFAAGYSNYGATSVDIAAPGSSIYSTWPSHDLGLAYQTGTSAAAPMVASALALMKARYPADSHVELIARLLRAVDPLPSLQGRCLTGGRLNLAKAVGPSFSADFQQSRETGQAPLTVAFTDASFGPATRREWNFGDGSPTTSETSPSHTYLAEGRFSITLTLWNASGDTASKTNTVQVLPGYQSGPAPFAWAPGAARTPLTMLDNTVVPVDLPFPFSFYGQSKNRIHIASNGLMGFAELNLGSFNPLAIPNATTPNALVAPYWDDLNPALSGGVWWEVDGVAPNRRFIATWESVARTSTPSTLLTFQAILRERDQGILFQYLEVQPTQARGAGRRASVGIESFDGLAGVGHTYLGVPNLLSNNQALLFLPLPTGLLMPALPANPIWTLRQGEPPSPAPATTTATLRHAGNTPLDWEIRESAPWLEITPISGRLEPGGAVEIALALAHGSEQLPVGRHTAEVQFINHLNGHGSSIRPFELVILGTNALLAVEPPVPALFQGPAYGPLAPAELRVRVANTGDAATAFEARSDAPWILIDPRQATLEPGAALEIALSIRTDGGPLPPGAHAAEVQITNTTSGRGSASFSLSLELSPAEAITLEAIPRVGGGMALQTLNPVFGGLVLESGEDAATWTPELTNRLAEPRRLEIPLPTSANARFFRLRRQ